MIINVSIVVPVFEQWHLTPYLLNALKNQTVGEQSFELIFVDNGSQEASIPNELPTFSSIIYCRKPGSYAARNVGISTAKNDWILFTDADCKPVCTWIEAYLDAIGGRDGASDPMYLVGAINVVGKSGQRPTLPEVYEMVSTMRQDIYARKGFGATANICISRALIEKIGKFDSSRYSGGDREFGLRASTYGIKAQYVPMAQVVHPARVCWEELKTKQRRLVGGKWSHRGGWRKLAVFLTCIFPPVRSLWWTWVRPGFGLRHKGYATLVSLRLWTVRIYEALRLLLLVSRKERR